MWDYEDDLFLCRSWQNHTVRELSKILSKSIEDVRERIKFFKLRDVRYEQGTTDSTVAPHYWYYKIDKLYTSKLSIDKASVIFRITRSTLRRARLNREKGLYIE